MSDDIVQDPLEGRPTRTPWMSWIVLALVGVGSLIAYLILTRDPDTKLREEIVGRWQTVGGGTQSLIQFMEDGKCTGQGAAIHSLAAGTPYNTEEVRGVWSIYDQVLHVQWKGFTDPKLSWSAFHAMKIIANDVKLTSDTTIIQGRNILALRDNRLHLGNLMAITTGEPKIFLGGAEMVLERVR